MKLGIIGIGKVGSQFLTDIQYMNQFSEITVIDSNEKLLKGEVLDHQHMQGLASTNSIDVHVGDYKDLADANLIVITASTPMDASIVDRTSLARNNKTIVKDIMSRIEQVTHDAIIIFITNPVDAMTYIATTTSNYPKHKILGTGTLLESARFRKLIANHYNIDPKSVEAFVMGEHGKHAVPIWSRVRIAGMTIEEFEELYDCEPIDKEAISSIIDKVAFDVLHNKGWTNTAISRATVELVNTIVLNQRAILPVTSMLEGEYNKYNVGLGMPTLISNQGVEKRFAMKLDEIELQRLADAEAYIKEAIAVEET